ncbi:MAG: IclR family transcriptional regulator [Solirubrobacteraceae bacterium]
MPAGALERAVALLQRLGQGPEQRSVAELAGEAGVPTSTAYRLLSELAAHGLVARSHDATVSLGPQLVALGRSAEAGLRARLVEPAAPVMERLAQEVAETVLLTAPCGLEALVLHVVETDVPVRLSYAVLRRAPMHLGASGKVLAAYLEPAERQRLVEAVGVPGLDDALEGIRASGYAYTVAEIDEGAAAVAAPILDRRGRLLAGLSIAGPTQRIAAGVAAQVAAVRAATQRIERSIVA